MNVEGLTQLLISPSVGLASPFIHMGVKIYWARIDMPASCLILRSTPALRHVSYKILISHLGIDEEGKKGIFPSNYVRSPAPA